MKGLITGWDGSDFQSMLTIGIYNLTKQSNSRIDRQSVSIRFLRVNTDGIGFEPMNPLAEVGGLANRWDRPLPQPSKSRLGIPKEIS